MSLTSNAVPNWHSPRIRVYNRQSWNPHDVHIMTVRTTFTYVGCPQSLYPSKEQSGVQQPASIETGERGISTRVGGTAPKFRCCFLSYAAPRVPPYVSKSQRFWLRLLLCGFSLDDRAQIHRSSEGCLTKRADRCSTVDRSMGSVTMSK